MTRRAVVGEGRRGAIGLAHFAVPPLLASILSLFAVTARADPLAGDWYTEGVEDGEYVQVLDHRRPDGTFTIVSRVIEDCRPAATRVESGSWHYADGYLKKWTLKVGIVLVPDAEEYHDSFLVTPVGRDQIELLDAKTHLTGKMFRVAPDFKFPTPAFCANS